MSDNTMTELTRLLAGRFQIEHKLGTGEHSEVFAAISVKSAARRYALKCYKPTDEVERYMVSGMLQRAGATRELKHENILAVHGYVLEKDYYIVVVDVAEGHDAASYLKKLGPLSPFDVWTTTRRVLTGLAYAHAQGITHGNLKPSNIFLPLVADAPVLVGDFGLGALGWNSTTTIYAAPEYLKEQQDDPRSDIYSLGIIVYELLVGKLPFTITAKSGDGRKLQRSRIEPSAVNTLPPPLNEIVLHMIDRDPSKRFATAAAALQAMDQRLASGLSRTRTETSVDERRISGLLNDAERAFEQQNYARSKELLAEAAILNPNDMEIKTKYNKVNDVIRQQTMAEEAIQSGREALRDKRYEEAVRHLSRAERLAPSHHEIPTLLVKARQLLAEVKVGEPPLTAVIPRSIKPPLPVVTPEAVEVSEPEPPLPDSSRFEAVPARVDPHYVLPPTKAPWLMIAALSVVFVAAICIIAAVLWSGGGRKLQEVDLSLLSSPIPVRATAVVATVPEESETEEVWLEKEDSTVLTETAVDNDLVALSESDVIGDELVTEATAVPQSSPTPQYAEEYEAEEEEEYPEDKEESIAPPSRAIVAFRTKPSSRIADVYINDVYYGMTVDADEDENPEIPPLHKENFPVGDHTIKFVDKQTGKEYFHQLRITNGFPMVYILTVEDESKLEPKKPTEAPNKIPTASPADLESPPRPKEE